MALLITTAASFSFAQTAAVILPATLAETMGAMGKSLKTIGMQSADASLNSSTLAASTDLVLLIVHAQTKLPPKVEALEGQAKTDMIVKYNAMMSQLAVISIKVVAALQANKNELLPDLLKELKEARKAGHAEFMEE